MKITVKEQWCFYTLISQPLHCKLRKSFCKQEFETDEKNQIVTLVALTEPERRSFTRNKSKARSKLTQYLTKTQTIQKTKNYILPTILYPLFVRSVLQKVLKISDIFKHKNLPRIVIDTVEIINKTWKQHCTYQRWPTLRLGVRHVKINFFLLFAS